MFVHRRIIAQVTFVSNQNYRNIMTVVLDLGRPLIQHASETVGRIEGKADENDLSVGIAEDTKSEATATYSSDKRAKSTATLRILLGQLYR